MPLALPSNTDPSPFTNSPTSPYTSSGSPPHVSTRPTSPSGTTPSFHTGTPSAASLNSSSRPVGRPPRSKSSSGNAYAAARYCLCNVFRRVTPNTDATNSRSHSQSSARHTSSSSARCNANARSPGTYPRADPSTSPAKPPRTSHRILIDERLITPRHQPVEPHQHPQAFSHRRLREQHFHTNEQRRGTAPAQPHRALATATRRAVATPACPRRSTHWGARCGRPVSADGEHHLR